MKNMKVCLVALVILVSNQATAENERTSGGRQAKQLSLSEPEQKYDLELSFPVDSDEATNVDDGRRERIDQLIQEILSNEALVSRNDDILYSLRFSCGPPLDWLVRVFTCRVPAILPVVFGWGIV